MPLLKKKALEKAPMPDLRDDEEVFHCEMTNEIFRDYEEFAERTILCNSMVWTCSVTGKTNLTYVEALQSEEIARKSLKDFPIELRIPVLFIANRTRRASVYEMAEDVFAYVKDRYFVGENIEACFSGNKWRDYHVLQVIGPSSSELSKAEKSNGNTSEHQFFPPPSLYKYDLEQLDTEDDDVVEKMIVDFTQIRRRKGVYTRERNRLFIKQYVEQNANLIWSVKESVLESFGVNRIKFDHIFDGPLPNFKESKTVKTAVNGKKVRQETLAKYLTKNNSVGGKQPISLIEELKRREFELQKKEDDRKLREELRVKKDEERLKKRRENTKVAHLYKEWCKPKEDLELEDQKKLPDPTAVKTKVPDKYIGDMLMVVEFVNSFPKILSLKNFFPGGFTVDVIERALVEREVAGPLIDLIQMLLNALFALQEEELSQVKMSYEWVSAPKTLKEYPTLTDCAKLATVASRWARKHHGVPLGRLPMYSLTVSEILRLHLLSSGALVKETGARWRFQQRGGYTNEDDPGLYICQHEPYLIKALSIHNIVQFSICDKLKIVSCLIGQLLTYADVRDIIEDRLETSRQHKLEIKNAQFAERRRCIDLVSAKAKLKSDTTMNKNDIDAELEKMTDDNEKQIAKYTEKITKLMRASAEHQVMLGYDRAFRRYLRLESVPGIFIDPYEENAGSCMDEVVHQCPELVDADRKVLLDYIRNTSDEMNTSDKENEPNKSLSKLNGASIPVDDEISVCNDLLVCSAEPKNCPVHSNKKDVVWKFFYKKEHLDDLINSLNKRGVRESELLQVLQSIHHNMTLLLEITPSSQLNPSVECDPSLKTIKKGKNNYEDANFGYPSSFDTANILHVVLTENILEMEEKLFSGNLGSLKIKDRSEWRKCLSQSIFEGFDRTIVRPTENGKISIKEDNGEKDSRESTPDITHQESYTDPGLRLGSNLEIDSEDSDMEGDDVVLALSENQKVAVECLSIALVQVAYGIDPKYLKRPLGNAERKKELMQDVIRNWEISLLASTSYSQVFLHYGTLDSCVMWGKSVLNARCRVCHKQGDSENLLLCDGCNYGQHLYCITPKLDAIPQGEWFCFKCLKAKEMEQKRLNPEAEEKKKKKRRIFRDEDVDEEDEEAAAPVEVVDKASEEEMDDEQSEVDEMEGAKPVMCTMCGTDGDLMSCEKCSNSYHIECVQPPLRRMPRGTWTCMNCRGKRNHRGDESDSSIEVSTSSRRSGRREAEDLPLHNAALHDLLADVMKNVDAWPFIRPVQKNEVPDYYDVISKPMDFGTIKNKLNMGKYTCDEEFMADAVLIFENCNTYNDTDAEVYRCGVRLLKLFEKKSKELGLKLPEEMQDDDAHTRQPKNKKRRTK